MNQININEIFKKIIDELPDHEVTDITCGPHVVAVKSRKTGLATWACGKHPVVENERPNPQLPCSGKELASWIEDRNPMKASLGLAALNALLPDITPENLIDINAGDLIMELGKGKTVAVIGHFPFVEKMKGKFNDLMVFEKSPAQGDISSHLMPEKLPLADIIAITATTIANKTLDDIISNSRKDAVKLIIGPSTPMCMELLKAGFDYVAGSVVEDEELVKKGILAGLSFKKIKGVRHVIIK